MVLDKTQRKIVDSNDKRICVIAGAGSGKTRCLVERVKRLLNDGVSPYSIVCITLTNMAASEMRDRLKDIPQSASMFIGTIHSYAYKLYYRHHRGKIKLLTDHDKRKLAHEIVEKKAKHLTVEAYDNWSKMSSSRDAGYALRAEVNATLDTNQADELAQIFDFENLAQLSLSVPLEERAAFIRKHKKTRVRRCQ